MTKNNDLDSSPSLNDENSLIEKIVTDFLFHSVPDGRVLYAGSGMGKQADGRLTALGIDVIGDARLPNVIIYSPAKNRLTLLDAINSHGVIDAKRRDELQHLFRHAQEYLILVTAFETREDTNDLCEVAWGTEAWFADEPSHMIHFNGGNFLDPRDEQANSAS